MNYKERLIAGLIALGYTPVENERSKYQSFTRPGSSNKMFVGPSGALRCGDCASKSFSVGCPQIQSAPYLRVLNAGYRKPVAA